MALKVRRIIQPHYRSSLSVAENVVVLKNLFKFHEWFLRFQKRLRVFWLNPQFCISISCHRSEIIVWKKVATWAPATSTWRVEGSWGSTSALLTSLPPHCKRLRVGSADCTSFRDSLRFGCLEADLKTEERELAYVDTSVCLVCVCAVCKSVCYEDGAALYFLSPLLV